MKDKLVRMDDVTKIIDELDNLKNTPSWWPSVPTSVRNKLESLQPVETLDDVLASLPKNYRYVFEIKPPLFELWTQYPNDELKLGW